MPVVVNLWSIEVNTKAIGGLKYGQLMVIGGQMTSARIETARVGLVRQRDKVWGTLSDNHPKWYHY